MISITLWWLFLIPIVLSGISFFLIPKISSLNYIESACWSGGGLVVSAVIITAAFYIGVGTKTSDTEIMNGQIAEKIRKHGTYEQPYNCMCSTDSQGHESCQTCYETHYTVNWYAKSTIGDFDIDSKDSTSRRVYQTPDPAFYSNVKIGEACARQHKYTNYIKAVPESLFRPAGDALKSKFAKSIPAYPGSIYNLWHIDRVLSAGVKIDNVADWNNKLSDSLRDVGPAKQANVVIVLTNTNDPNYSYALQDAWLNGKKNDIVLIIGTTKFPNKADWVHVLALTDNELFKIQLRDDIMNLPILTSDAVIGTLHSNISKSFVRKSMKDFKYLNAEIDPPTWINVSTGIFVLLAYIGFLIALIKNTNRFRFVRY